METILAFFTEHFWATATGLLTISTMITGSINGKFNPNSTWKQVIAWLVSIVLTVGCYFLGLITVANPVWLSLAATGLIVGLASNGFYDIKFIKEWIQSWFSNPIEMLGKE